MNNLLINFKQSYLIFFMIFLIVCLYLLMIFISKYKSRRYIKLSLKEFKDSPELFLRYLDQYYITNKFYTFSVSLLYTIPTFVFFIYFSYKYLGYILLLTPSNLDHFDINLFIYLFLYLILIVMIKSFFDLLFFKEVLKTHLYLLTKSFYNKLIHYYKTFYLSDFFGKIHLFLDCISKFKIEAKDSDPDYTDIYLYLTIYENKKILNLSKKCVEYSKKSIIIHYIFKILNNVFCNLYLYMNFHIFLTKIPFIILFCIFLNDILNYNIHYTYYVIFILFFIRKNFQFLTFLEETDGIIEYTLSQYFYNNKVSYKIQRALILEKNIYYIKEMKTKSEENNNLLYHLNDIIIYVLNNLKKIKMTEEVTCGKRIKAMSFRLMITILLVILTIYILININNYSLNIMYFNIEIPIIILLFPIIAIILLLKKIYYLPKNSEEDSFPFYTYNKSYARIFWIITILQSILLIFLIYRSNMALYPNEYLFNSFGIEIIKHYTALEKQEYFYYYLYNQILLKEPLDAIRIYYSIHTEYYDIIKTISVETSFKEIQTTINILINYYAENHLENKLNYNLPDNNIYYKYYFDHDKFRYYFDPFKNIIITIVFHDFIQNYTQFPTLIYLKILLFKIIKYFMLFSGNKIILP